MVKLGFIVEGFTEKIILEHSDFFAYLDSLKVAYIASAINAKGSGHLLPNYIDVYITELQEKEVTDIFILTDLDTEQCITNTKRRIDPQGIHTVVVSAKTIESWFLADTEMMRKYFNDQAYYSDMPESF